MGSLTEPLSGRLMGLLKARNLGEPRGYQKEQQLGSLMAALMDVPTATELESMWGDQRETQMDLHLGSHLV